MPSKSPKFAALNHLHACGATGELLSPRYVTGIQALPGGAVERALEAGEEIAAAAEGEVDFKHERKIVNADRRMAAVGLHAPDFQLLGIETTGCHEWTRASGSEAGILQWVISYIKREN